MSHGHRSSRKSSSSTNSGLSLSAIYRYLNRATDYFTDMSLSNTDKYNLMRRAFCKIIAHRDQRFPSNNQLIMANFNEANPLKPTFYFVENPRGVFDPQIGTNLSHSIQIAGHFDAGGKANFLTNVVTSRNAGGKRIDSSEIHYDGASAVNDAVALRVNPQVRALSSGAALSYAGVPVAGVNPYGFQGGAAGVMANAHAGDAVVISC